MKRRIIVYLGIAAVLAAALLAAQWMLRPRGPVPNAPAAMRPVAASATQLDQPCLEPDARLLMAVGEVHRILTGTAYEPATARFERGKWWIVHRGVDVGPLPELPEFGDLTRLLSTWATRLGARSVFVTQTTTAGFATAKERLGRMHAVLAASECDRLAGSSGRSAALLELGTRALARLELETTDDVGIADRVAARALALVATCRALDSTAVAREACLLSHRMGYGAAAWAAAEGLAPDDPIRLYVRQEDARLAAVAAAKGASAEARYLHLLRLARTRDHGRWTAWMKRAFGADQALALPVLGTGFAVGRFETQMPAAYVVFVSVARELRLLEALAVADTSGGETPSLAQFVRQFEGILAAMPAGADGLFLDRDLLRAYYRGSFYTALWTMGEHYRRALSSLSDTRDLASELAELDQGPAGEFGRWYTHLAEAKSGQGRLADLRKDLQQITWFGAPLLIRTFEEIHDRARYGSLESRMAAVSLARRLDTRPQHRAAFSTMAGRDLLMLPLAEDLLASAARAASPLDPEAQGWWARLSDDRARLEALLAQPDLTAGQEAVLIASLSGVTGADSAVVCAAYQRAIARHPESWRLVSDFVNYASLELKAYPLSRAAVERWLARNRKQDDLEVVIATATLARTYEREGRWADALRIAGPVAASQQFGAMARKAVALEHLGRSAEAETLAVLAWLRYPDNAEAQSLAAEMFWRHGRPDQAARVLSGHTFVLAPNEWRWTLAPHFVACFADRPAEALAAADTLCRAGLPPMATVVQLAIGCGNEGRRDLAFQIMERVRVGGMEGVALLYHSYYQLKRWKGEPAGLEWLRPRYASLGAPERAQIAYEAYRSGDPELLWELGPVPAGVDGEFHWLMRAAASLRWRDQQPARAKDLGEHFARGSADRYRTLGRYLLGLEPDSVALRLAEGNDNACEVHYYLGLRAQFEGRYRDAADHYGRCVATRQTQEGEYQWAFAQLQEWYGRNRTLAKLAEVDQQESSGALMAGEAVEAGAPGPRGD